MKGQFSKAGWYRAEAPLSGDFGRGLFCYSDSSEYNAGWYRVEGRPCLLRVIGRQGRFLYRTDITG